MNGDSEEKTKNKEEKFLVQGQFQSPNDRKNENEEKLLLGTFKTCEFVMRYECMVFAASGPGLFVCVYVCVVFFIFIFHSASVTFC